METEGLLLAPSNLKSRISIWVFPKTRVPYFGVLVIRILLCRLL